MQFSKYVLGLAFAAVLVHATEQPSLGMNKETPKQTVAKASTIIHSHETPKASLIYDDYSHGYGGKDYDSKKTTQKYEDTDYDKTTTHKNEYEDHHSTKVTHDTTKILHESTKETHKTSQHSMYVYGGHHNTSIVHHDTIKHMMTSTATSTKLYMNKSTITVIHSEATFVADHTTMMGHDTITESLMMEHTAMTEPMMMDTTSSQLTFNPFTMSSCTECITAPVETGLITASVSAQDFTLGMSTAAVSDIMIATPTYNMQSTLITAMTSATTSAPSAGFASTSRAVFTGLAGRQGVDYLVVVALPALVSIFIWV